MHKLEIKKPDGTNYWTEYFTSREGLDLWLKEEQTRPYWNKSFLINISTDNPIPIPEPDRVILNQHISKLKSFKDKDLSNSEMKEALNILIKLIGT